MIKHAILPFVVALTSAFAPAAAAQNNPGELKRACVQRVVQAAATQAQANLQAGQACADKVSMLVANGQTTEARTLAMACAKRITVASATTVQAIATRVQRCVRILKHLGAPKLAQVVGEVGSRAVNALARSRVAALQAIRDALQSS